MITGALLELENITINYGPIAACRGVSLAVNAGQCTAVVGPNGAGKSTLAAGVAGLIPLTDGIIRFKERNLDRTPSHERARSGLVVVPEGRHLFPQMSVEETLSLSAAHARPGPWSIDIVLSLFRQLAERSKQMSGNLSGGEQQMLAIARGLVLNPEILVLDEPSAGLAPKLMSDVVASIAELVEQGLAVLLIEQNVHAARKLAENVFVMNGGEVTASGGPELLGDDEELRKSYLGA